MTTREIAYRDYMENHLAMNQLQRVYRGLQEALKELLNGETSSSDPGVITMAYKLRDARQLKELCEYRDHELKLEVMRAKN